MAKNPAQSFRLCRAAAADTFAIPNCLTLP